MALEEYLMSNGKFVDEYMIFYIHAPSVIIGKYQSALSEVNMRVLEENNIYLARRLSGGGAVYHDEGNLNFSFVCHKKGDEIDFSPYVQPVIDSLIKLGVNASLGGRNDMLVGDKKIGGNAQHISGNKVLCHGTVMVDVNIENMSEVLSVDPEKYSGRGISSVRSRVANISDFISQGISAEELREILIKDLSGVYDAEEYVLTDEDRSAVGKLVTEKFSKWEYNFGGRVKLSVSRKKKLPAGLVAVEFDLDGGTIRDIHFSGDFFARGEISTLEEALKGVRLRTEDIISAADGLDIISGVSAKDIAEILIYE